MKPLYLFPALALLLQTAPSWAFCRATTCDVGDPMQHCQMDVRTECVLTGEPLYWAGGCLTVNVQSAGAPRAGISADAAEASVRRALDTWLSADCGGALPSIAVEIGQRVSCDASEYKSDHHNANIVMFREGEWPYVGAEDALGLTRLRFDLERVPGEIWDADIELNAVEEPLAVTSPKGNQVDLDSLMTHEIGHLFGLGHSLEDGATMMAGYSLGSTELRSLTPDDVAGMCAIYPPGRSISAASCEARHGFSELCAADQPPFVEPGGDEPGDDDSSGSSKGCAMAPATQDARGWLASLLLLGVGLRRRLKRS
jgi:hypothetical protein